MSHTAPTPKKLREQTTPDPNSQKMLGGDADEERGAAPAASASPNDSNSDALGHPPVADATGRGFRRLKMHDSTDDIISSCVFPALMDQMTMTMTMTMYLRYHKHIKYLTN